MLASISLAHANGFTLHLCHEDNETFPWILKDQEGLYAVLARLAAKKLDAHIELNGLPWKRCLAEVKAGRMDGVMGAGFLPERCEIGVYPPDAGCKADPELRMYVDRYALYRNWQSELVWDGKLLSGNKKRIAVQPGFIVGKTLQDMGVAIDESDKEPNQMLRKAADGMVDAAVIQSPVGDKLIRESGELGARVIKMPVAVLAYPTYVVLSHQFVNADPKRAQMIWKTFAALRTSPDYLAAKASFSYSEPD